MFSLSTIPEPTNNAPKPDAAVPPRRPLPTAVADSLTPTQTDKTPRVNAGDDAEQQVDSVVLMLLILIAGGFLRLVLGLLGPMQGVDEALVDTAQEQGRQLLAGNTVNAYPLFDLMALGTGSIGIPPWCLVAIGSFITLAAVPGAYLVGQTLTGRRLAGILGAAIVAVHPAVLTASNSFNSGAIALGTVTLGLASICLIARRCGIGALFAGALLGLAGLLSPLCWLVGLLCGPMVYRLAMPHGLGKAFASAFFVVFLAVAPAMGYRIALFGSDVGVLFAEFQPASASHPTPGTLDRMIVNMTDASFHELGQALHLPIRDAGRLKIVTGVSASPDSSPDVIADTLADGWLLLNAALSGLAAISVGILLIRRRFSAFFVLAIPLSALALCTLPPSEALRLPMLAMLGILSTGLFATRSPALLSDTQRQARQLAKQAKQQAKDDARQQHDLRRHNADLFAFDTNSKPQSKLKASELSDAATRQGNLPHGTSMKHLDATATHTRPI